LEKDLKKIKSNRALQRQAREKEHFPIIALVGYTNAGKSTLFNKMTNANVLSKDMVFATLDPTMRGLKLPNGQKAIMSDTVGFIRNLPTELIAAFSATLEEVVEADIILHVQDVSNAEMQDHAETVLAILDNLGVDQSADNIFNVYNKIDILAMDDPFEYNRLKNMTDKDPQNAGISSYTGEGIDQLLSKIVNYLTRDEEDYNFELPVSDGKALSWLHDNATVLKTDYNESDKVYVSVRMGQSAHDKFVKVFGY
jgi:GTP-binding protein HflX